MVSAPCQSSKSSGRSSPHVLQRRVPGRGGGHPLCPPAVRALVSPRPGDPRLRSEPLSAVSAGSEVPAAEGLKGSVEQEPHYPKVREFMFIQPVCQRDVY